MCRDGRTVNQAFDSLIVDALSHYLFSGILFSFIDFDKVSVFKLLFI